VAPRAVEPLSTFVQRDLLVPEGSEVDRAVFLPNNMLCLVLTSFTLQCVRIADKPQLVGFQHPSVTGELAVLGDRLLGFGSKKLIQFIEPKTLGPIIEMPFTIECPRAVADTMYFVANECMVYFCNKNDPVSFQELIYVPERISTIEICESFHAIVVITTDNILRVCTFPNGDVTALVNLSNEPDKVILTPGWGFIVVVSGQELTVYTINGDMVGRRKLAADVRAWDAFADHRLIDFLVWVDEENQIGLLEVGRPEGNAVIVNVRGPDIFTVRWVKERSCVAAVTGDGILASYPIQLNE
jgi:hypothetical protein